MGIYSVHLTPYWHVLHLGNATRISGVMIEGLQ